MSLPENNIKLEISDFGICNLSVVPVRAAASDTAEIVTQLLFGDHVKILKKGHPWIKIRFEDDQYEGWMDFKQLTYISEEEYLKFQSGPKTFLQDPLFKLTGPRGPQNIMLGAALPNLKSDHLVIGNEIYSFTQSPNSHDYAFMQTVLGYLNTPYLWGGKSIFGIDCSGFVQNCFKVHGTLLPRDASQQVSVGELVSFENRQEGDVPFFMNAKGNVHHVGILTAKNKIIHAAGCVRTDAFDEKGIFRKDLDQYTHQYHSIRRFNPNYS